jgi:hypothetical protein
VQLILVLFNHATDDWRDVILGQSYGDDVACRSATLIAFE